MRSSRVFLIAAMWLFRQNVYADDGLYTQDLVNISDEQEGTILLAVGQQSQCVAIRGEETRCWGWYGGDSINFVPLGLTNVSDIVFYRDSACAVDGGSLRCWGWHSYLAPNGFNERVSAIAANSEMICVATPTGVTCWRDQFAQLSEPPKSFRSVSQIALGKTFGCVITEGRPECWGESSRFPPPDLGLSELKSIHISQEYNNPVACLVKNDHTARCWDTRQQREVFLENDHGANVKQVSFGYGTQMCFLKRSGSYSCQGSSPYSYGEVWIPKLLKNPTHLKVTGFGGCVIDEDRRVSCWYHDFGSRTENYNDWDNRSHMMPPQPLEGFNSLRFAEGGICGLKEGQLQCFGADWSRLPVTLGGRVDSYDVGENEICAYDSSTTYCWSKRWGERTESRSAEPGLLDLRILGEDRSPLKLFDDGKLFQGLERLLPAIDDIFLISGDTQAYCVARSSGEVICVGGEIAGSFEMPFLSSLSSSHGHACAIDFGELKCWGNNQYGQSEVPAAVKRGARAVTVGAHHTCALKNGLVTCWGRNDHGQIVDHGVDGVREIVAKGDTTCAIFGESQKVACWGLSSFSFRDRNLYTQ